jgi:toxin ParE1/3/4
VTLRVVIEAPAKADLAASVRWYKQIRPGLEADFRLCVWATVHRIARNPEAYAMVSKRLRRALTDRFPFGVFYLQEPDAIHVLGVLHNSRDPLVWQSREH